MFELFLVVFLVLSAFLLLNIENSNNIETAFVKANTNVITHKERVYYNYKEDRLFTDYGPASTLLYTNSSGTVNGDYVGEL